MLIEIEQTVASYVATREIEHDDHEDVWCLRTDEYVLPIAVRRTPHPVDSPA